MDSLHRTDRSHGPTRRLFRVLAAPFLAIGLVVALPAAAFACGGLVAPNHAEVLQRATTLSAWHDGYEHYVTGFQFAGTASAFGYIVPLPGAPTKIEKGGAWTLERLQGEIGKGPLAFNERDSVALTAAAAPVQVLQQVKIDALNITVVRGGGADVAKWAAKNGFDLTADTPRVLGHYSSHGSVFALARFDRVDAQQRGLIQGQGEVIHFTIPTDAPWIPLRILALGKAAPEFVDADLFVLTDEPPSFYPTIGSIGGMTVKANEQASTSLLADLRGDKGMGWLPVAGMWFTALDLHTTASEVTYDLSIDGGGPATVPVGHPIPVPLGWPFYLALIGGAAILVAIARSEQRRYAPRPA